MSSEERANTNTIARKMPEISTERKKRKKFFSS